jgi:SAM-dependent methyltransferase
LPLLVNAGSGPRDSARLPPIFDGWQQLRVDADPTAAPDLVADIVDLSAIGDDSVDAIWASHCIEHLYAHQVRSALAEFHRILRLDGFACIIVPDLQTIARYIVEDRLHEVVYRAPAGPVTAHDIVFGFAPSIAAGHWRMAHRCGFTPALMLQRLGEIGFGETILRRRPNLELAAVVGKRPLADDAQRDMLLARLQL